MSDRRLFLHIGHTKTGSSYLQSVLAGSKAALAEHGLWYPLLPRMARAAQGAITSGNGMLLTAAGRELPTPPPDMRGAVFSSEKLFGEMRQEPFLDGLMRVADALGCGRIEVLLLIRNPMGHLSSAYQQGVKRGGLSETIDAFAPTFKVPITVRRVLTNLDRHDRFHVTVRNYDRHRHDLLSLLAGFLDMPADRLTAPPVERVNRSLDAAEFAVQRRLNAVLGVCGRLVADPVCEELPDIAPANFAPDHDLQHRVLKRNREAMNFVNARIPPSEHYVEDVREGDPRPETIAIRPDQLDIIVGQLAQEIRRLRDENEVLRAAATRLSQEDAA